MLFRSALDLVVYLIIMISSKVSFQVVGRDLIRVIRKKRPVVRTDIKNVIYPHDNAPAHTAAATDLEIALLGFQRLSHPPYSPDLAPLDFAYFPMLKSSLRGHRFDNMVDILHSVQVFNISLRRQWFENVFKQWVRRHEECVEHSGRYFESCDYVTLQVRGDVNLTLTFSGPRGYTWCS